MSMAMLIAALLTFSLPTNSARNCHSTDREALLDFLAGVDNIPYEMKASWKGLNCCSWFFVQCNNHTGRVTKLLISDAYNSWDGFIGYSSLNGSLSESLGKLSALEVLEVERQMYISGKIPESISNISTLKDIYLGGNNLTGGIPSSFGALKRLKALHLDNNQLSGAIPSELGYLQSLEELALENNQFSGSIPASLGKLKRLQNLDVSSNKLGGSIPSTLGWLRNLSVMNLYSNKLVGSLPKSFQGLSSLNTLDAKDNLLVGPLPSSLAKAASLRYLSLARNHLTGSIPSSWASIVNLSDVDLSSNKLEGQIPPSFSLLTRLSSLHLSNNKLHGSVPDLSKSSQLGNFYISFNNYRLGFVPRWIKSLPADHSLSLGLASCGLNSFPDFLPALNLYSLDLSSNNITGQIPYLARSFENWLVINLSYNPLHSSFHSHFSKYTHLTSLDLRSTHLRGSVAPVFSSNLTWLSYVDLSDNQLTGQFPSVEVRLATDQWSYLNFSGNSLVGSISKTISNLGEMELLDLSHNKFSRSIPQSLGTITTLQAVLLNNNKLSGKIPKSLGNLTNLVTLNLSYNKLSGEIPVAIGKKFPRSSFQKNPNLCGSPLAACHKKGI